MNEQMSATASSVRDGSVSSSHVTDKERLPEIRDKPIDFLGRHFTLIAISAVLGAIAGLVGSFFMTRYYRAEVVASPVYHKPGSHLGSLLGSYGALASLAGFQLGSNSNTTYITLAVLDSHRFVERFISKEHLLPILFSDDWDASQSRWILKHGDRPPSLEDAYRKFTNHVLTVLYDKRTDLITVRIEWTKPKLAAQWANDLVAQLNAETRHHEIRRADIRIEYLTKELNDHQPIEVRRAIYTLLESEANRRMIASTQPDYSLSVIDPAQAPERKHYVRPMPLVMTLIGLFVGSLLAIIAGTMSLDPFSRDVSIEHRSDSGKRKEKH